MTNHKLLEALAEQIAHNEKLEKELKKYKNLCKERGRKINMIKESRRVGVYFVKQEY